MDAAGAVPAAAQGPWYLTTGQRVIGTVAGIVAVIFGLIGAISVFPTCIIAGVLDMAGGLMMLAFEAPFLVRQLEMLGRLAAFWEHRSQWYKVILYALMGVVPLFLGCWGFSICIASIAMIVTAALYGMAALGRRGAAAAAGPGAPVFQGEPYRDMDKSGLVESQMYSNNQGGFR